MARAVLALVLVWPLLFGFYRLTGGPGWWQSWVVCLELLLPMTAFAGWAARRRPEFLVRRTRVTETRPAQRRLLRWGNPTLLLGQVVPGLDRRLGGPEVPLGLQVAALVTAGAAYLLVLTVYVANPWAGRTIATEADQQVVDTGPYAWVRHPMYAGVAALYLALPLGLGSWWGLAPAAVILPMLVVRIRDEEAALSAGLAGYPAYARRVRWRLIPGLW